MTIESVQIESKNIVGNGPINTKPLRPIFDDLGKDVPSFDDYFVKHIDYIKRIQALMCQALDDDPVRMDKQAREAEGHKTKMKSILAFADGYLDVAEHIELQKIGPRSTDYTDMDRSKALLAAVARQRRFRDVVRGICESITERCSYAQTRLRTFAEAEGQKYNAKGESNEET